MLTITDFVNILREVYPRRNDPASLKLLEEKTIANCPGSYAMFSQKISSPLPQR